MKKILVVDLTAKTHHDELIDQDLARDYIGGSGLAARLLYDQIAPDTDPLGPENPLLFLAGPMVGTSMPSAGRCTVNARSPLTGLWGESNTGGFIGPEMRFAGYDGVLFRGASDAPCWISIISGEVQIREAEGLWGQDTYQTQESIREILGDPKVRVACIGAAGENLVKMAGIINDHGRAAGRTGMGAVMGSKKLKAVAFRGTANVPLADPDDYKNAVAEIQGLVKDDIAVQALRMAGTAGYVDMGAMFGDMPAGYFQLGEWEESGQLSGVRMAEEFLNRGVACYRCPIMCGRETRTVKYKLDVVDGPEYETVAAFGSLALVDDLEGVIYAGHLCNLHGLDTISTGSTIALACDLFEKGILTANDTGGLEIRFGDVDISHQLIGLIARREGFGDLLAEGSAALAAHFSVPEMAATVRKLEIRFGDVDISHQLIGLIARREGFGDLLAEGSAALAAHFSVPEMAATVRKLEIPMHDARSFSGMAPVYALSPRGACHLQGDMYGVDTGQGPATELGILPGDRFENSQEKGRITARAQAWRSIYNALTVCHFMNPGASQIQKALTAATGWEYSLDDLLLAGKRIFTLKRMINLKLGSTAEDDRLPEFMLKSMPDGGTTGFVPDLKTLLLGAYLEHGWDPETGLPTPDTLASYGLDFTISDLP